MDTMIGQQTGLYGIPDFRIFQAASIGSKSPGVKMPSAVDFNCQFSDGIEAVDVHISALRRTKPVEGFFHLQMAPQELTEKVICSFLILGVSGTNPGKVFGAVDLFSCRVRYEEHGLARRTLALLRTNVIMVFGAKSCKPSEFSATDCATRSLSHLPSDKFMLADFASCPDVILWIVSRMRSPAYDFGALDTRTGLGATLSLASKNLIGLNPEFSRADWASDPVPIYLHLGDESKVASSGAGFPFRVPWKKDVPAHSARVGRCFSH